MQLVGKTWLPDGDGYFPLYFARDDVFNRPQMEMGLRHVKRFRTAIDGGAHVGSWTRYLATKFQTVRAFEPEPENFDCLETNVQDMDNVLPYRFALGASNGRADMEPGTNSGCWHLVPGSAVPVMPLDSLNLQDVDYLKLDLEGGEYFALIGSYETVMRCRPVVQIEEKDLPHAVMSGFARRLLEHLGYREVDRCQKDVVFACA